MWPPPRGQGSAARDFRNVTSALQVFGRGGGRGVVEKRMHIYPARAPLSRMRSGGAETERTA